MRRSMTAAVLAALALLCLVPAARGLAPCDYRSPITALTDARLLLSYRYYNDAATPVIDVNSGRISLDYDQIFDSPNYGFSLVGSGELTLEAFVPSSWLGQGTFTFRMYPFRTALFFGYGGLEASMVNSQPQPGLDVRIGLGVGRFSDVTPLAKAILIESKLLALQSIIDPLPDAILLAIASVLGRAAEYESVRAMVVDIESVIEPVAGGVQLGAPGLLSIEEIIVRGEYERRCGWAIQGGLGYELIDPYGGEQNLVMAGSADAALATSPDDQLLFHASFSGPFEFLEENTINGSISYAYQLSEDSTMVAGYSMQRVKPAGQSARLSQSAHLALTFDLGGVDVGTKVSLTRDAADPGWSIDINLSASMDLI